MVAWTATTLGDRCMTMTGRSIGRWAGRSFESGGSGDMDVCRIALSAPAWGLPTPLQRMPWVVQALRQMSRSDLCDLAAKLGVEYVAASSARRIVAEIMGSTAHSRAAFEESRESFKRIAQVKLGRIEAQRRSSKVSEGCFPKHTQNCFCWGGRA